MRQDATAAEAVVVAVVAVVTEAPPGARVGVSTRVEAVAEMEAPTGATEEAEEAMEVVHMVVGTEAPARGSGAKGAPATYRVEDTSRALTELAAAAPRRTADRVTLDEVATLGAAEPPEREATGTSRGEVTEAAGKTRAKAPTELTDPAPPAPRRTTERTPTSLSPIARGVASTARWSLGT